MICLSSCSKHEDVLNIEFQVGNILCDDGSVLHPSLFRDSGKKAVGIVFWTNEGNNSNVVDMGYAVSLEDLESEMLVDASENISSVSEDETAFDGAANTAGIISFGVTKNVLTPAATTVCNYSPDGVAGWFIPSAAQSKQISANINKIYDSFDLVNGSRFSGWYWTSTEDGSGKDNPDMYVLVSSISEGRLTVSNKKKSNKIRPIIAIK